MNLPRFYLKNYKEEYHKKMKTTLSIDYLEESTVTRSFHLSVVIVLRDSNNFFQ